MLSSRYGLTIFIMILTITIGSSSVNPLSTLTTGNAYALEFKVTVKNCSGDARKANCYIESSTFPGEIRGKLSCFNLIRDDTKAFCEFRDEDNNTVKLECFPKPKLTGPPHELLCTDR